VSSFFVAAKDMEIGDASPRYHQHLQAVVTNSGHKKAHKKQELIQSILCFLVARLYWQT